MLAYDIFKQPEDAVWGFAGAARFPASGAADGVTPQSFPYIARVYPDQPTPGVGVYSDVIVIEVLFD